jgi:D-serine deaminase-like pyridoxal phosphate-dependent protein
MVVAGRCRDVLVTNQIVGAAKLERLARLAGDGTEIGVLVDHPHHVQELATAASNAGVVLTAYVEVDAGQRRCGVEPGSDTVVELASANPVFSCRSFH